MARKIAGEGLQMVLVELKHLEPKISLLLVGVYWTHKLTCFGHRS